MMDYLKKNIFYCDTMYHIWLSFEIYVNDNSNMDMIIQNQSFSMKFIREYKNEQAKLKENVIW